MHHRLSSLLDSSPFLAGIAGSFGIRSSTPTASPANSALFTTYFCHNADPQRTDRAPKDDISYIGPWYESVTALGIRAVVFHDGMSEEFIEQYQTDRISFEYVAPDSFTHSVNDYRFIIYLDYLTRHPEIAYAFMTDGNDVRVVQSPFPSVRPGRLYVGSEPDFIEDTKWMQRRIWLLNQGSGSHHFKLPRTGKHKIYNAGLLGGHRDMLLGFLQKMKHTLQSLDSEHQRLNLNMAVFNYLVYRHFRRKAVTGNPIHSVYKQYEDQRSDVWFIHK